MEEQLLTRIHKRLIIFRDVVVTSDAIVPSWVNDSIEEIEAAQQRRAAYIPPRGGMYLEPKGSHASNPFDAQDKPPLDNIKQRG